MSRVQLVYLSPGEPSAGGEPGDGISSPDYLWDKTGKVDPDLAKLESVMGTLRMPARPLDAMIGSSAGSGAGDLIEPRHQSEAHSLREHLRRKNAWVMPAMGMVALFGIVGFIGWPMRPWGPGTQRATLTDGGAGTTIGGESAAVVTSWEASLVSGAPVIGAKMLSSPRPLSTSDWLTTDSSSRAKLVEAGIGTITVEPNSSVRVTKVLDGQHWFELAKGRIEATIHAPPKLFFVKTKSTLAVDMGCAYTLETDEQGNGELHVTMGWVELQREGRSVRVPRGKKCAMLAGVGPGTPIDDAASQFMVAAIARFDDRANQKSARIVLDDVLSAAGEDDGVTLWHVLQQVAEDERGRVIEKLGSIVPPPAGLSRDLLLRLDPTALDQWWNDIRYR